MDSDSEWETWDTSYEFINNFEIPVVFDSANVKEEKVKIAFSFKRSSIQLDNIETRLNSIAKKLRDSFFKNKPIFESYNFELYDNDIDLVQIIASYINKWFETKKDIVVNFPFYNESLDDLIEEGEEEQYLPNAYEDYYISDDTLSDKEQFL